MTAIIIDDHLLRDVLTGERASDLGGIATEGLATTGLWLFRLCSSFARSSVAGRLSAPVSGLPGHLQALFRAQLASLPETIQVVSLRQLSWSMAELQQRHRVEGRGLSAAMVEALAAAHWLDAGIAVSQHDVGPNLLSAAKADGVAFHIL